MISFRTEFNLRKKSSFFTLVTPLPPQHATPTTLLASTGTEAAVHFLLHKKGDQKLPLWQVWSWHFHWLWEYRWLLSVLKKRYFLMLQFILSLFCTEKTEHQSKFSSYFLYKSQPSESLRCVTTSYQFSSLCFGIRTLQLKVGMFAALCSYWWGYR